MNRERWLLIVAVAAGVVLRVPQLSLRPMHTDEAVHAVKFGTLLETGTYRYDKNEYHGPTLNYLTLIPAWLLSEHTLVEVTEKTLRIVPVVFGVGLILILLLLRDLGEIPIAFAAMLTAVSPAMVFYSRYYIQEMLLVFFTFGLIVAGYRLFSNGQLRWAVAAGICAGLMFSTKETWVIPFGAILTAGLGVLLMRYREGRSGSLVNFRHVVVAVVSGIIVSFMLFSSFFTNWQGVADSGLAYQTYFDRAGRSGSHFHPWYYFLQMLTFSRGDHGPVWSEAAILLMGCLGVWDALFEKAAAHQKGTDFRRFLALYAFLVMAFYSVIQYKTPWVVLGPLHAFIVMAGLGMERYLNWVQGFSRHRAGLLILALVIAHLAFQAYLANYRYYEDPVNPYVYAHPTSDVKLVASKVVEAARLAPGGLSTPVQVLYPGDEYWPLPWYLRLLPKVGWWSTVTDEFIPTSLILVSPELEPALLKKLYEAPPPGERALFVPLFDRPMWMRPSMEIRGYVTLDLWNRIRKEGR